MNENEFESLFEPPPRGAEFRSKLETEDVSDTRFVLLKPLVYYSAVVGREIIVPTGFVTDFASVPRSVPLVYDLTGGEANRPAVIHDYLYVSHEVDRATADAVFREAMAVDGQPWWRRTLMWAGVRVFGGKPYESDFNDPSRVIKGETP